jgi:hypothetical protein
MATVDISFDDDFTKYTDNAHSSGYAFFALFNSVTSDISGLSIAIPYTALDTEAKQKIRDFVKHFYTKDFSDDVFDMLLETHQRELFSKKEFKFREKAWTFNTIIGTQSYSFATINATDIDSILAMTYDTYPIDMMENEEFITRNSGTTASGVTLGAHIWNKTIYLSPTPSEVKEVKIFGYKSPASLTDETSETDLPIPQYLSYRVLQDLWAVFDTKKASFFAGRADQIERDLIKNDNKHFESTGWNKGTNPRRGLYGEFTIS